MQERGRSLVMVTARKGPLTLAGTVVKKTTLMILIKKGAERATNKGAAIKISAVGKTKQQLSAVKVTSHVEKLVNKEPSLR